MILYVPLHIGIKFLSRKIKFTSKTGTVNSEIKTFKLSLLVEKIDYLDNEDLLQLEIKGKCCVENEYMNLG